MAALPARRIDDDKPAQRELLAAAIVRRQYKKYNGREGIAELAGINKATLSKLAKGDKVSDDTWLLVSNALGWDSFLDFVRTGSIHAIARMESVPLAVRQYAIERLREISGTESD